MTHEGAWFGLIKRLARAGRPEAEARFGLQRSYDCHGHSTGCCTTVQNC